MTSGIELIRKYDMSGRLFP